MAGISLHSIEWPTFSSSDIIFLVSAMLIKGILLNISFIKCTSKMHCILNISCFFRLKLQLCYSVKLLWYLSAGVDISAWQGAAQQHWSLCVASRWSFACWHWSTWQDQVSSTGCLSCNWNLVHFSLKIWHLVASHFVTRCAASPEAIELEWFGVDAVCALADDCGQVDSAATYEGVE